MNPIFKKRLEECNISITEIMSEIKEIDAIKAVFAYTSHIEGLGTKDSDFDIYVISDKIPSIKIARKKENSIVQTTVINDIMLDIEYWHIDEINKLIDRVNNIQFKNVPLNDLKLIQRLMISELIDCEEFGLEIRSKIKSSNVCERLYDYYSDEANSQLDDAINLLNSEVYISALFCARLALENSIGALNAKKGFPNMKLKWAPRIFLNNSGYGNDQWVSRYLGAQVYCDINCSNVSNYVEEIIDLSQEILSNLVTFI